MTTKRTQKRRVQLPRHASEENEIIGALYGLLDYIVVAMRELHYEQCVGTHKSAEYVGRRWRELSELLLEHLNGGRYDKR